MLEVDYTAYRATTRQHAARTAVAAQDHDAAIGAALADAWHHIRAVRNAARAILEGYGVTVEDAEA